MDDSAVVPGDKQAVSQHHAGPVGAASELRAFNSIVSAVEDLDDDARRRVVMSALTFLGLSLPPSAGGPRGTPAAPLDTPHDGFSEDRSIGPKEFMLDKKPVTDVER